jgi:hypothetical protein
MLVVNVINLALWDKARWKGVALLGWEGNQRPPGFCLLFEEAEAGTAIFREWRERFQGIEAEKWLRVSIIEGLDGGAAYAVHLTAHINESVIVGGAHKTIATLSRFHVLHPAPGSVTLSRLREEYARHGAVFLVPAVATAVGPHAHWDLAVRLGRIEFRHVRDIGEHDMDSVVLRRPEAKSEAQSTSAAKKARRRKKKLSRRAKKRARK